ncbi:LysM peptidoglycan-binding domain-containing protein [uncultured Tenacibaculum sp.]|uniref:LysM peptidoglycan-binding domain-containing protein n=1 Tax=uncultured Tenacibaculum sp. TaxID=174713 RepID=UPI002616EFBF|nr:LysM peptidoglycan-binding domain-containing protein [uncultured Tenacibaculum sp.]
MMMRKVILLISFVFVFSSFAQEKKIPEGWDKILLEGKVAYMNLITGDISTEFPKEKAQKPVEVKEYDPTITHKVQKGETLSTIARKYKMPLARLYRLNNLVNFDEIEIGDEVVIGYEESPKKNKNLVIHIVQSGETLYSIAKKYNTSISSLKINNKIYGNNIVIGQKLMIN